MGPLPAQSSSSEHLCVCVCVCGTVVLFCLSSLIIIMADKILGTYNMTDSENFDEFMKGVGLVMRKMGNSVKPSVTFTLEGATYTMKTSSSFKTFEVQFQLGKPSQEPTMDGRESETTFTLDGNVLTQVQVPSKGKGITVIRTFTDAEFVCVFECDGVKATRTYKRA